MSSTQNRTASEKCWKCNGSGQYRTFGVCFSCKGTGKVRQSSFTLSIASVPVITSNCEAGEHSWIRTPDGKSCEFCGEKIYGA